MRNNSMKTVMVFGTFDLLHPGHIFFLLSALILGNRLVVSVSRDSNVLRIKGRLPLFSEQDRARRVRGLGIADLVILGDKTNYLKHILKVKPEIIALGYDQKEYTQTLRADLLKVGLRPEIIRLKPFKNAVYKSSKLKAAVI